MNTNELKLDLAEDMEVTVDSSDERLTVEVPTEIRAGSKYCATKSKALVD